MIRHATCIFAFWPFSSPWMLGFGAAALAPLLIHLWNKRQHRETNWAAMQYLMAALRRQSRRIRLEQLALLAVRCLIPLLLAAALADPVFSLLENAGPRAANARTHFVIVLDGSYSMEARSAETSCFQRAQEHISRFVEQAGEGDGFSLILMSDAPLTVIDSPAFDPADVIQELEALRPPHGGARLEPALAEIESVLQKTRENHREFDSREVFVLSDLGENTWSETTRVSCRERLARLAQIATLHVVDVGSPGVSNRAITRLTMREGPPVVQRPLTLEAEVSQFGPATSSPARIQMIVDGQTVREAPLRFSAEGLAVASLTHVIPTHGEHLVEARLTEDALPLDNHRWLSLPVQEAIRVLCIGRQPSTSRYLALALAPESTEQAWLRPDVRPESALAEADLAQYDCLMLSNLSRFSREESSLLRSYLEQGGAVVFFLGDEVQADVYNIVLGENAADGAVLPVRVGEPLSGESATLDPLGYQHPLLAAFRGHETSGLLTTPIWKYWRVTPLDPAAARVALAMPNGDPLIVEQSVGMGRCIVVATASSPDSIDRTADPPTPWNAFAEWPSFVPLVHELAAFAVSDRTRLRNVLVGERLEGSAPNHDRDPTVTIVRPDERQQRVTLRDRNSASQWRFDGTAWSGVYRAQFGSPDFVSQLYAVNLDTRESDLTQFDSERLPSQMQRTTEIERVVASTDSTGNHPGAFRLFLGCVLALLMVESLLAWQFGRED